MSIVHRAAWLAAALLVALRPAAGAEERFITVASTTSTEQSGLFDFLLPAFTRKTGIAVRVVAVGTGQALKIGERGDADVVFVHDKASELKFLDAGYGVDRREVMYNDFVLIGPKPDPAKLAGGKDIVAAFKKIAAAKDVKAVSGTWYRETGSGMGPTLNTAAGLGAYTLSDRGTWLNFKNRGDLAILVEGDRRLFNQYGVMLVNPARHPGVKVADGRAFIDWLTSPDGQRTIAGYKINGEPLFFPDYGKPAS